MGEHGVSLENMANMESMEKMETINQMTWKLYLSFKTLYLWR